MAWLLIQLAATEIILDITRKMKHEHFLLRDPSKALNRQRQ